MRFQMPEAIFTMGAYGFESEFGDGAEAAFFQALTDNQIDLFIDTRLRRGFMYGAYPYASKTLLIKRLGELEIGYAHLKNELAPTKDMMKLPREPDEPPGLSRAYVRRYNRDILGIGNERPPGKSAIDAEQILAAARKQAERPNALRPLLFCVEAEPQFCHRSLAAAELARQLNVDIVNLVASSAQHRWRATDTI